MAIAVEVHVACGVEVGADVAAIEQAVRHVLRSERVAQAELSVALLPDPEMEALNREYLGHAGPTDVISFPLSAAGARVVGDVYVGAEQARRQAEDAGVTVGEELLRLAIHGTLHVLGYDHPHGERREDAPMYARQEALLRELSAAREAGE